MYQSVTQLAKTFGLSRTTVYRKIDGIRSEIGRRYNDYAILDNRVSAAVFADYLKFEKSLNDDRLRRLVPEFDMNEAAAYIEGGINNEKSN